MPGTPNYPYGAEIGLAGSGKYMEWDDSPTRGFTSNDSWVNPSPSTVNSVLVRLYAVVRDMFEIAQPVQFD